MKDNNTLLFPETYIDYKICSDLEEHFHLRPLKRDDFEKGYTVLLEQLTYVGNVSKEAFQSRFDELYNSNMTYYIIVIEDVNAKKIVTTGTLFLEKKFTHETGLVGHIEDVIVDSDYRKRKLGSIMVNQLKNLGINLGCYKLILDCNEEKEPFYISCGFKPKERQMAYYNESKK